MQKIQKKELDKFKDNLENLLKSKFKKKNTNFILSKNDNGNYIFGNQELIIPEYIDINILDKLIHQQRNLNTQFNKIIFDEINNYNSSTLDEQKKKINDDLKVINNKINNFKNIIIDQEKSCQSKIDQKNEIEYNLRLMDISNNKSKEHIAKYLELNNQLNLLNGQISNIKNKVNKDIFLVINDNSKSNHDQELSNNNFDENQKNDTDANSDNKINSKDLTNMLKENNNIEKIEKKSVKIIKISKNKDSKKKMAEVNLENKKHEKKSNIIKKSHKSQLGGKSLPSILKSKKSFKNTRNISWENKLSDGNQIKDTSNRDLDILIGTSEIDLNSLPVIDIDDNINENIINDNDEIQLNNNNEEINLDEISNLEVNDTKNNSQFGGSKLDLILESQSIINNDDKFLSADPVFINPNSPMKNIENLDPDQKITFNNPQLNLDFQTLFKYNDIKDPDSILEVNKQKPIDPNYLHILKLENDRCSTLDLEN